MIHKEYYAIRPDGVWLYRSYSDAGVKIHKVGTDEVYDEAIDVESAEYVYEETDIPVESFGDVSEADYQNALREMGVEV